MGNKIKDMDDDDQTIAEAAAEAAGETIADMDDDVGGPPARDATLAERFLWLRDRVGYLQKDSSVGGKYKAISHDKITAYIRPKMVQAGIFHWVTCIEHDEHETGQVIDSGRKIMQHRAVYAVTFESVHDKEDARTIVVPASADDYGDKGPGKAISYAVKYALLKMSMVETGEEDEERTADEVGVRVGRIVDDENMMANLWTLADELFGDDAKDVLKAMSGRRFFVESYGEIPQDRYDDAIRALRHNRKLLDEGKAKKGDDE